MIEVTIEADKAVFEIQGWDQLWSLRSRLEIPLTHVNGAHVDPDPPMGWFDGIKLGGTGIPNIFKANILSGRRAGLLGCSRAGKNDCR